jgi:hypothetical protein
MDAQEQNVADEGAEKIQEAVDQERVEELKDEIERIETGLPNAAKMVQGIKDKLVKAPPRKPNTPEISVEDQQRVAAEEAEKYGDALGIKAELAAKKDEIIGRVKPLVKPEMAGGIRPEDAGPKGAVGAPTPIDRAAPTAAPEGKAPRLAQLDPRMILNVELIATKKKLAEADEKMGLWAIQDARRRKQELDREEAALMAEVSRQLGVPAGTNIRLVDKDKGICQVE